MEHTALRSVLILLAAAVLILVVLKRVRLPTVIAYLVTGFAVGPYGLGWIANSEDTRNLAEFGVVFLLFTLGLEFSMARLVAMRKAVFLFGGLQVLLTALRREGVMGRQPALDTILKPEDVLVLWGTPEDLEASEAILLRGAHAKPAAAKDAV